MSNNDDEHHHHHHHHHKVLDKISNKISSIKEEISTVVKERTHSTTSDRRNSITSDGTSASLQGVSFHLADDPSPSTIHARPVFRHHTPESDSLPSLASSQHSPTRHGIDQLALNMGFGGVKASSAHPPSPTSLVNTSLIPPQPVVPSLGSRVSIPRTPSPEVDGDVEERLVTKVDPLEMTAAPAVESVQKDPVRRAAMLLAGPKFQLNSTEIAKGEMKISNETLFPVAIIVGVISLIFTLWKPISSYFSGTLVGGLFAAAAYYIWVKMFLKTKAEETAIEEWIDFPALEAMLAKIDKEDKNTSLQTPGASIAFQRYDADRDDDFVRYPCELRLDGYRLIVQLASKSWDEEKKSEKEMKFIGYREYLIKEAGMMLVPEATLTRAKYWMNDYPIVLQDLQILDKQIHNKQQLEKSKLDTNDFFTNNATILSIWFETAPQKEEWFHKLSLTLRKGKEEIERKNSLLSMRSDSFSSSTSNPSLHRRLAQTETDAELGPSDVTESEIHAALIETKINSEELGEKAKGREPETDEIDASGTHRTASRKTKTVTPNEASLQSVLKSPECLDEAAITINFMARRLLCDMFEIPIFKDLLKSKVEMKMRELAVSILENLRVTSIDMGNTFPVILKIEPMQWNTQGIWFNLFLYYRGSFKLSVRTRVLMQKLINYDPKRDKPIFAQHHSAQIVHKDEERLDEEDLVSRQKLLAKEPEVPEMAVSRKLGTALTNLALNKYFQMFANIPFVRRWFEKFSEEEVGAEVEVTSFSGLLTLNIPPPPSDRIWVGFPEMPDMTIKVVPTYGEKQYDYTLLKDFLAARIRAELKRLIVLPAMDDQLLPFFRDWVIDIIGQIVAKPVNPLTDNYKQKLNDLAAMREGLQKQPSVKEAPSSTSALSMLPASMEASRL